MAPIPGMIREAARFENQYRIYWIDYGQYTKIATTDMHTSYSKLANISHELQDKWVVITSVLFAIIVVGIIAHCCFLGRYSYPRQTAPTEDKTTEDAEYPDMVEGPRSDGWMCFILACHAAITLGVV
ncbi:hypothetical protein N7517_011247 [Penicillium concentricum]|uniref:Uncharacterized protein n=1 Tax=Penicillium concentricum TaxID=293559 RepID=A0A9W9RFK9_9EURO|nr:uncharacterized protein N7517_011247 [Penicillium concentricum]KAJ5356638.1 hypothetical protein N7517_011247 [Penicillium concentricum]